MKFLKESTHQAGGLIWAAVWMWPLLAPAAAIVRGDVHPRLPAAIGFVLFAVLYLWVVMIAFDDRPRPRRPTLVLLVVMAAVGVALVAGYGDQPSGWLSPLLYVAVAGAATLASPRHVAAWLIGGAATTLIIGNLYGLPADDIGSTVFSAFMAGALVYVVRQMLELIRQLRQTQEKLAESAVAQERLRFSRDLHDLLGHTLSLMVVKAELTRRLAPRDPVAAAREAGDIETIGRTALLEVRQAVTGYRERTLAHELDGARAALSDAGIAVTVRQTTATLPAPVNDVLAWTVREVTTNVIRHSGATRCEIDVRAAAGTTTLEIVDNGSHEPAAPGNGLRGLGERLHALGGTLVATTGAGGGFRVVAEVPSQPNTSPGPTDD